MDRVIYLLLVILIDILSSIGIFLLLNFIFLKAASVKYNKDYEKYNFYFYILSNIISSFIVINLIEIFNLKIIGYIYLLVSVLIKILRLIKLRDYIKI